MGVYKCDDDGIFRKGDKLYTDDEVCDLLNEMDNIILKQERRIEMLEFLLSSHTIFKVVK